MSEDLLVPLGFPHEVFVDQGAIAGVDYICEPLPGVVVGVLYLGFSDKAQVIDLSPYSNSTHSAVALAYRGLPTQIHTAFTVDSDPLSVASAIHLIAQKYK